MAGIAAFPAVNWVSLLGADPRPWLWESGEPAVRSLMLRSGLAFGPEELSLETHRQLLQDAQIQSLIALLPDWETVPVRGHNRPAFAPNLLIL